HDFMEHLRRGIPVPGHVPQPINDGDIDIICVHFTVPFEVGPNNEPQCSICIHSGGAASYFEYTSSMSIGRYASASAVISAAKTPTTSAAARYWRDSRSPVSSNAVVSA